MSGTFTPPATGLYTLHIENYRNVAASATCLKNFIDNISLVPSTPNFEVSGTNVKFKQGGTMDFSLHAGAAHANDGYCIWMSVSGTYPGFNLTGQNVPLNVDPLFLFSISNPNFPGSVSFLDTLDANGEGTASLTLPIDLKQVLYEVPIHFAYVVASNGFNLPLAFTSHPVHVKYIP